MNYSYEKKYNKNHLILNDFDNPLIINDYKLEMLKRNSIEGLLDMQLSIEDSKPIFYYDITGKQSFHSYFYNESIKKEQIVSFLNSLYKLMINLNKYLLDYNHIVLIPQCVFFEKNSDSFSFVYCPNHNEDFFSALKEYISYILTITDHKDEATVLISYSLFQEVQNENFNMKSLLKIIENNHENIVSKPIEPENIEPEENCILKEPDVLLKENYVYEQTFMLKNLIVYGVILFLFILNIFLKLFSVYSGQLFFIILVGIVVFCIFYTSNVVREAPLHKVYEKVEPDIEKNIIRIKTEITPIDDDNCETVLLCQNPNFEAHKLIYTGIDYVQETILDTFPFTIGKNPSNLLTINNPLVSRSHARILKNNDTFFIEDLNSSNGTKINDTPIASYTLTEINSGDIISFADLTYIFQ